MRLLENNGDGQLSFTRRFFNDEAPPYAILSHTWGSSEDEIHFEDIQDGSAKGKHGYEKLQFTSDQATKDGLRHIWIDTCCIHSSDSSELQESINSMFQWYQNAAKCYVFLSDVSRTETGSDKGGLLSEFCKSRWFRRGWTLQELLAPVSVEFFSKEGIRIGDRDSLESIIGQVTGIPGTALRGFPLSSFTVLERIRWQDNRDTLRPEDAAYSLFGIFGIQIPLIYGEGRAKAFRRLQKEINDDAKSSTTYNIRLGPSVLSSRLSCTFETGQLHVRPSDEPFLRFENGVTFKYWHDGHFFVRSGNGVIAWATHKWGKKGTADNLCFQHDGNLVAYSRGGPMWASNTDHNHDSRLVLSSDKPFVEIFTHEGTRIFKS